MKKLIPFLLFAICLLPFGKVQAISSEVHIDKNGKATVSQAKVMQIAGSTLYTRLYWGESFVRLLIKTNSKTKFLRATNEVTTISEISEGDLLEISGELESGSSSLTLLASNIKNSSVQKQEAVFSGKVTGVELSNKLFYLNSGTKGIITVKASSTTIFTKGTRTLDIEHVKVGDYISKATGDYDIPKKTLTPRLVLTYVEPNYYKPRNFQGTLTELTNTSLPGTIKVNIEGVVYTINLNEKTSVMNTLRNITVLNRFVVGDTIRIYGVIREIDDPIIDAEIVRNINL